ncbi:hypothetical protein A2999_01140 [Candidatus Wolfebacteria bacterium RIFCSPLOWO2_01_FULL_38_11]|uniref:Alkyl hydroperoxide reductase, F subunit n=2 Tax=Candidatus Wolfeibacteriota TaxID=1752735 RepID=A0A0G0J3D2_9BACT|nr:MAG: Alkyl hydroperoxide reductase, F subunit [Candidatus Wolfebacteria bacterium GW2011_GWC1_37_10]OGM91126.1 MAG: hypothetical protein A2999_01140 [Candidatus Wolfebacteria bacterium RIFCSPLOWO2_01_FULL_38_11]
MLYDLIIIGGGPAGVAAGIYASRKKLKTLLITESIGGQPVIAGTINNFIGFKSISGIELKNIFEEHLHFQGGVDLKEGLRVEKIVKKDGGFLISANNGESFETKVVLIAVGSSPKRLNIPGEEKFEGKGVFYCSICDAPLMKDKVAAVIGGGNSGYYSVLDLLPYASKIYVLEYGDSLRADPVYQDKANASGKVEVITMAAVKEILGDDFVRGLKYEDRKSGELRELKLDGVFVAIGYQSNSGLAKNLVEINQWGKIVVNHQSQTTSLEGVWAAGDVTDVFYNQINIAVGDAVKAVLNIYDYLNRK